MKEALFINPSLKTWTEIRLLNTSVEAVQVCVLFWHRSYSGTADISVAPTVWLRKHSELSVHAADVRWISDMFS